MDNALALTARTQEVLAFIRARQDGATVRDIGAGLEMYSSATPWGHIKRLVDAGLVYQGRHGQRFYATPTQACEPQLVPMGAIL